MSNISIEQIVAWANDAHMVLSGAGEYSEEYAAARAISELASELLACRKVIAQPVGEVVAWNHPTEERKVDFRWLDVNVEPGTLLFSAQQLQPVSNPYTLPDVWIKCSERMPDEFGRYWCYVEEQNSLGKSHYQWNCSWNGDCWSDASLIGRVTHWMPLAAAPRQEVS